MKLLQEASEHGLSRLVDTSSDLRLFQAVQRKSLQSAKEAGVTMTGAGSPFPYKKDPDDSVIRIAPTYPSLDELKKAAEVFVVVTRLVSVNKLLEA